MEFKVHIGMSVPRDDTAPEFINREIMTTAGKLSLKRVREKEIKKTSEGEKVGECASLDLVRVLQREARRMHMPNDFC